MSTVCGDDKCPRNDTIEVTTCNVTRGNSHNISASLYQISDKLDDVEIIGAIRGKYLHGATVGF